MKINNTEQTVTISKSEIVELMHGIAKQAENEYRYDTLTSLSSFGEFLNGMYALLNNEIYFEEEDDGELYAQLLDKANHPELWDGQIETYDSLKAQIEELRKNNSYLQTENAELKKEIEKLRYELNCNAWFNVWKDEVAFRLREIYERNDVSDELINEIADRMTTSDRVSEEICYLIDAFLEDEGIRPADEEEGV